MEGKELYDNEDEELDPKKKKDEEDGDDFGLPEIEESEVKSEDIGDPYPESWEEEKEEKPFDYSESTDEQATTSEETEPDFSYDEDIDDNDEPGEEDEYRSSYYEEEYGQKKFPIGWVIFGIFVLIAIIIAIFWWFNRNEPAQPVQISKPVIEQPVQEEPEPEPVKVEPEPEPEPVRQAGVFEINEPTGRYHVIVASSIDKDLVRDYGNKLASQGMMCNILAPRGNKKFHRLSVADFMMLNDAAVRSEQLKSTLGEDVWVIRY